MTQPLPAGPASGAERLAAVAYAAAMRLLAPAMLLRVWRRGGREPGYRERMPERLGFYGEAHAAAGPVVWVHAVSLGETRAADALLQALRQARPGLRVLLTHGTATGREAGRALLQPGDAQAWLPWDSPGAVRRFFARHRPAVGVLMETEVWPTLLREAGRRGVPMVLANARLSSKSLRQAHRLAWLMRPAVRRFAGVLAQTEADAQRLREAGVAEVVVAGNLKFDMAPDPALLARGAAWRAALARPVLLAASTREGEEAPLLAAWRQALAARPAGAVVPLLLVVPRHPQRFDEVAVLARDAGWAVVRRSALGTDTADDAEAAAALLGRAEVCVGDSLGELPLYYALADVALLGGSFAPLGGQNLIEAAACGCPLVIGPSTFNFAEAAERSLAAGAAQRAADLDAAVQAALRLLDDPATRQAQSDAARRFAAAHRGAAARMAAVVVGLLPD